MSDNLTERIAEVLAAHRDRPTGSPHCACGWRPAMYLNDTESDRQQHREHQAEQVRAVLGETTTEWGVRYEADRDHEFYESWDETTARFIVASSPTDTALVSRECGPWTEVPR